MNAPPLALRDPELDRRLAEDGYVIMDFLDGDEVEALRCSYTSISPPEDEGLTIDFMRSDRRMVHATADLLAPMWERHVDEVFLDHRPVVSTFVVKHPGPGSDMVLHNEPTFVDPELAVTYNVWIPLVDVQADPPNGALELVSGSHRLRFGLAGYNTPLLFRPYEQVLREHTVTLDVPAGSAVVYDSRVLHVSGPNLTPAVRPAIAAALAPRSVPLVHVVACGRRRRRLYGVDEGFFLDVHPSTAREVAESGHRVVREAQDDGRITPSDVAVALGIVHEPVGRVAIPDDLGLGHVTEALTTRSATLGRYPVADVEVGAGDLGGPLEGAVGLVPVEGRGVYATLAVGRRGGRAGVGADAPSEVSSLVGRWRRGLVAVLDEHARLTLAADADASYVARVYECPMVNAGIATPTAAAALEVGDEVLIDGPGPFSLWNDGPGPVWVVLTRRRRKRG